MKNNTLLIATLFSSFFIFLLSDCSNSRYTSPLDRNQLAQEYFGADSAWYLDNIPFFECSDKEIEQVYYYRWKLYKAHIRNVGENGFVITEFINHVSWDREPFCTINAASMHHIYEGRWLKDPRYMDGYIHYLYQEGGNDRKYSESVADASYGRYLVNADPVFIIAQLDSMKSIYSQWDDHWEAAKNLYYIPAMPDATEFTIASIDASGGKDGFDGGDAFRPTINSYQYGNALAIAHIAFLKGDTATGRDFMERASQLKSNVEKSLWNDSLQHFTDRFKVDNQYVRYWDFIRGRELAGFAPWYFNLPDDNPTFNQAWKHISDTTQLLGQFGFRTNEPSYEYYFHQFLYHEGKRGSQWNGPSWPYQTSQAMTAMANFLNNYEQEVLSKSDYMYSLRLFTKQHYLPDGKINLVENYDPNLGGPIVHYLWSNHYNHSTYNNLVISGLCGIRPSEGDSLTINPLVDNSIRYFCLDEVPYHGHLLTIVYDLDGTRYKLGKGLILFVDGKKRTGIQEQGKYRFEIGKSVLKSVAKSPENKALNIRCPKLHRDNKELTGQRIQLSHQIVKEYPIPSASVNSVVDSLYQAIDGRIWYFPEITNGWSTLGSTSTTDWYAIDFGETKEISCVKFYPFVDEKVYGLPDEVNLEYYSNDQWHLIKSIEYHPARLTANRSNALSFGKIQASQIRIHFTHKSKPVFLSEIECY